MFINHLKIAFRHLLKNSVSSIINIIGLAVGMAVAMIIGIWIWGEVTFNSHFEHRDRIARVMQNQTFSGVTETWRTQPMQLAPELKNNYEAHFEHVVISSFSQDRVFSFEEKVLIQTGAFMDEGADDMLSLNFLKGKGEMLKDPLSIFIDDQMAKRIFGDQNPIGKTLQMDDKYELTVRGVYASFPERTSFGDVAFIGSWELFENEMPDWINWGNSWFQVFVMLKEGGDMEVVSEIIKDVKLNHIDEEGAKYNPQMFLHPMNMWHLFADFENGKSIGGRILYVWLFGIIGVFVLLLACINFMNLSTARSERRAKEVGIRKTIGSTRGHLIRQFFGESILVAFISYFVALNLAQLSLPFFNEWLSRPIQLLWSNSWFWLVGLGFTFVVGLISGSYPAIYLSSFEAAKAIKGSFKEGKQAAIPRKVLVVVQFTVSITLIIGIIIVFQQIQHAKDRPIGYNYQSLVNIPIRNPDIHDRFDVLRNELIGSGYVVEVAKSESPITRSFVTNSGLSWRGKDPNFQDQFSTMRISRGFGKTVGWEIVEGRDFSREFSTDSLAFVINEAAAAYMGFDQAVGEVIKWGDNGDFTVIGVVKNMIMQSPYASIQPMLFFLDKNRTSQLNIKVNPQSNVREALSNIEQIYTSFDPKNPFEYQFIDEDYADKFGDEERIGKLSGVLAILAILISCLGLFGLTVYIIEKRTKEIGIRKVLGATISSIITLLSKDFIQLVFIAMLIAIPISWYFMEQWLQNFEYRIDIQWWIFVLACLLSIAIAFFTISVQSVKAALADPVQSLRNE